MQVYGARPAFGKIACRSTSRAFYTGFNRREFHQSRCTCEDGVAKPPHSSRRRPISGTVQRGSQAAADVQELLNFNQSTPSLDSKKAGLSETPQPLDLRSLAANAKAPGRPTPVLRPRSSHPAAANVRSSNRPIRRRRQFRENDNDRIPTAGSLQLPGEELLDEDSLEPDEESEAKRFKKELEAYRREWQQEFDRPKDWTPEDVTLDSLRPYLPRFPFGEEGNAKELESRLRNVADSTDIQENTREYDLAQRLRDGHYVQFRSEEEKERVLARARTSAEKRAFENAKLEGEEPAPINSKFVPLSQQSRKLLEGEIVEGKYQDFTATTKNPILDKIIHLIRQNGSYTKADEASILKKLTQLLPATIQTTTRKTSASSTQSKRKAKKEA